MKYRIKLFVAFAASAAFASIAAPLALASGTKTGGATVAIAKSPLGRILVDSRGITLYDFPQDKGGASTCYGACAALWPPLTTTGSRMPALVSAPPCSAPRSGRTASSRSPTTVTRSTTS